MKHYERIHNLYKLIESYFAVRRVSGLSVDLFEAINALRDVANITDYEIDEICAKYFD